VINCEDFKSDYSETAIVIIDSNSAIRRTSGVESLRYKFNFINSEIQNLNLRNKV
jgi:hypothetical protein